jgi:hypothetical protein
MLSGRNIQDTGCSLRVTIVRHWRSFAGFAFVCFLSAAYGAPLGAVLSGGIHKISSLSITHGGGRSSGGALAMNAANIGGVSSSGTRMTGNKISLRTGVTSAVVIFAAAKNDLSAAHCYPVPFKPSARHTKITFTNLTDSVRIRIYTISGELVRTLDKIDSGKTLDWDVRNMRGSEVDSGVYLWLIEHAAQKKTGRLMIIR